MGTRGTHTSGVTSRLMAREPTTLTRQLRKELSALGTLVSTAHSHTPNQQVTSRHKASAK